MEPQADLYGASVVGPLVEAYVIATRDGGFQVDLWLHGGNDPYRIVRGQDLTDAVRFAVKEASAESRVGRRDPSTSE